MTRAGGATRPGRLRAAWSLVVLTPLCAELTFTAVAVPQTWQLLPLLLMMYGAGVLLLREAAVRVGARPPGLLLLALAYQLAEDGLGLRALTSPTMYGAAHWGWRALGVNWTYWVSQVGVHLVLSVLLPLTLADLLFPALRGRPYLRLPGLLGTALLAAAGVVGLRVVVAGLVDPGYRMPWGWAAAFAVAIAALVWTALRVLPRRTARVRPAATPRATPAPPSPPVVAGVVGVATLGFLVLLLPPGLGPEPLLGGLAGTPLPSLAAVVLALGVGRLVHRAAAAPGWTDRHRIALVGGVLVAHTAFMMVGSGAAVLAGALTLVGEVALLALLARHLGRRAAHPVPPANPSSAGSGAK